MARIGCNTLYPLGRLDDPATQFDADMQCRALDLIAEAGFHAVEFSHGAHLTGPDLPRIARHVSDVGLSAWSAHSWTALAGTAEGVDPAIEQYRRFVDTAQALGVHVLVVHCAGWGNPDRTGPNRTSLDALADMAHAAGQSVAIENGSSWDDWQHTVSLVQAVDQPHVGLNIDTGHANLGDLGVARAVRAAGGHVLTTHLQDNHGEQDDHLPPGQGDIDWHEALTALVETGYDGTFMVEISDRPPGRVPHARADTMAAAANLRRLLGEVGVTVAPALGTGTAEKDGDGP